MRGGIIFIVALFASGMALAQQPAPTPNLMKGTPQEQAACRGDSIKYCRDEIPDDFRVLGCLQQNRSRISKACRKVLENHGQ
jgi:hypothetical protein